MTERAEIPDDPTDDDLVRRAADGDSAAWDMLVAHHLASVVTFAWYRLKDRSEAEDIAQETLLRFSKKALDSEPGGAKVRTWLYRVAGNLCIDQLRARRPEDPIETVEETGVIDIQPHLDGQLDTRRSVHKALRELPHRQQTMLILVYYQGHTVKAAAAILTLSEHAAVSLLARACRAMRTALEHSREDLIGVGR